MLCVYVCVVVVVVVVGGGGVGWTCTALQRLRGAVMTCENAARYTDHVMRTCADKRASMDALVWTPEVAEEYGAFVCVDAAAWLGSTPSWRWGRADRLHAGRVMRGACKG